MYLPFYMSLPYEDLIYYLLGSVKRLGGVEWSESVWNSITFAVLISYLKNSSIYIYFL